MISFAQQLQATENQLWNGDNFDDTLNHYQQLFKQQEATINAENDERYGFILSIPIADRPEHLKNCLESIYQLCDQFGYGGKHGAYYSKVLVVVVEDSKDEACRLADAELAQAYSEKGLRTIHYNIDEQYELMMMLPAAKRKKIESIIGKATKKNFYRKGQAFTRNLTYLKLLQLEHDRDKTLYYFVDSDQLFQINVPDKKGDKQPHALNYFYYINQVFQTTNTLMLTGKLVGDPPVSPAVMIVNYLDDLLAFMRQLSQLEAKADCQFHPQDINKPSDAAYHDLSKLFELEQKQKTYDYRCKITGEHNHIDCLNAFSQRVNRFFFGEHLTRKTYFNYQGDFSQLEPARTIYPGNYIVNFEGLKYIIPFGDLRLRMSGPTAGRLVKSEIQERFVSINLPMLHARTLKTDDSSKEFRPGVESESEIIDLNDESERQFFGDLMLFTVDRMTKEGITKEKFTQGVVTKYLQIIEQELLDLYQATHENVIQKTQEFLTLLDDDNAWWHGLEAVEQLKQFIKNCQHNFGKESQAYELIQTKAHREQRKQKIMEVLLNYQQDREAWDGLFQD